MRQCGELIADVVEQEARSGCEAAVLPRLRYDAPMRGRNRLEVWAADGRLLYADPELRAPQSPEHLSVGNFKIPSPALAGGDLRAR